MPTDVITANTAAQNATADNLYAGSESLMIKEGEPTVNFSSGFGDTDLEVTKYGGGDHTHTLLRFTGLSNVPSGSVVSAATLYIYQSNQNAAYSVDLRRLLRAWVEAQATWNIYSTGNSWATAGGLGAGTDRTSAPESTTAIAATSAAYYALDCTSLVQSIIDGTISPDEGFHLERTDAGNDSTFKVFNSSRATDGTRPELVVVYTAGGASDDLLADDIESNSETTPSSINQAHNLTSASVQSASSVSVATINQSHLLAANDVSALSSVTSPNLNQSSALFSDSVIALSQVSVPSITQGHGLLADDLTALSEVETPSIAQTNILLANDTESSSETSASQIAQIHALSANSVQSISELTSPSLSINSADSNLNADDVESASQVSAVVLSQSHILLANNIESGSEVSAATIAVSVALLAESIESNSELTAPSLVENGGLNADNVESQSEVSSATLTQAHSLTANSIEALSQVSLATLGGGIFYPDISLALTKTTLSLEVSSNDLLMNVSRSTITANLK